MEIETVKVDCGEKTHSIVKYHLNGKDELLIDSLEKGAELAGKVNIRDPAGVPRNVATRIAKCSGGVIAERIFKDFMASRIIKEDKFREELSKVELHTPPGDYSRGQVDLVVRRRADKKPLLRIETRSSFSYITGNIFNVVTYAMSLLGPYTTFVKPGEETKDFHVTVIHRVDPADLLQQIEEQGIDSFIVGGGTKSMFQDSQLTSVDNLYQRGASYKIIKPIWKGLDAYEVAKEIIRQTVSSL